MTPTAGLVQLGELEGAPCIEVDACSIPLDEPQALEHAVQLTLVPAARAVVLKGEAAWGDSRLDRILHILATSPRALTTWCVRQAGSTRWTGYPIWNVLDCTALARDAGTMVELVTALDGLPPHPAPEELVLNNPRGHAISAPYLDELSLRLGVVGLGWLYVDAAHFEAATQAVLRATTPWGVRRL